MVGAVVVVNVVSRVIISGTVMLWGCHVGGCCVEIHSGGSCGVWGCRGCVCNVEGYSIRSCRVEGCHGCVTVLRVIVSGAVVLGDAAIAEKDDGAEGLDIVEMCDKAILH